MPYYITVGNHDVLKNGLPAANWSVAEVIKNYHMPWYDNISLWYSVDPAPGVHLVSLDSASDRAHLGDWGGAISPEQVQWLDQDLAGNAGKMVIVMTHHALIHHAGVDDKLYYMDNADQVKHVLNKHGAHLAITGHIHITDIAKNGSLIERSTPATCSYPCAYTLRLMTSIIELWH